MLAMPRMVGTSSASKNGDTDLDAIDVAIQNAKADTTRPSLILVHTTIGFGSPNKGGTAKCHGSPLGPDETNLSKKTLGWDWPDESFYLPEDAVTHLRRGGRAGAESTGRLDREATSPPCGFPRARPNLEAGVGERAAGRMGDSKLPTFAAGEKIATRAAAGKVQNAIAQTVPWLFGGDVDLGCSTKTVISEGGSFDGQSGAGRNIHFGVREHAMAAICNGLAHHRGVRPFAATFFCFSDYMRPSVRLAAMDGQAVIYLWTHDSIAVGEDGPTHQPVEHLMSLRAMPNLAMVRPADANETAQAWKFAMERKEGPTALVLTRQNMPVIDRNRHAAAEGLRQGAYVLADTKGTPDAIIIATGSEVSLALAAREMLAKSGTSARVVSMPCWEAFLAQPAGLSRRGAATVGHSARLRRSWRDLWLGTLDR